MATNMTVKSGTKTWTDKPTQAPQDINKVSNLVTACCFCGQCCFLESVSVGKYGGGTLIYLPEIDQAQT